MEAEDRYIESLAYTKRMVYCFNSDCLQQQDTTATNFCRDCGSALTLEGGYRAQTVIGESSFGRTLVAIQKDGSRCVIKQVYRRSDSFERDARRLEKLGEHPQIPTVIDAIDNELGQFIIQEFAEGESLQWRVESKGPLAEEAVRSLLKSLLSVLEYVHSFKIIHRDIKPANIILKDNNLPILVDFGAAKHIKRAPAKTVIGSADYAAPEQSMGQATFASDLYSLGVTSLYALTSVAPFTLYSASESRWVWRDYLTQSVDAQLGDVLDKMVAQTLRDRFDSAQQVAAALNPKNAFSLISEALPKELNPEKLIPSGLIAKAKEATVPLAKILQKKAIAPAERPVVSSNIQWQQKYRINSRGTVSAIALPLSLQPYLFAVATTDGSIHLYNLLNGDHIHTFPHRRFFGEGHSASITALCFHGRVFYSTSEDGTIKEWDSAECRLLNTMKTRGWLPTDLKVTTDGSQLVSANSDGQIVVWDIATLLPVAQLAQHQKRVNAIALSSGAMASASEDGTVKLWRSIREEQNRMLLANIIKTDENIKFLSFYQNSSHRSLITSSQNSVVGYDIDSHLNNREPYILYTSSHPVTAFSLSSEGYLMIGNEDRFVTVLDIETEECVAELSHSWGIVAITASQSSKIVVTASEDGLVTVWQKK